MMMRDHASKSEKKEREKKKGLLWKELFDPLLCEKSVEKNKLKHKRFSGISFSSI